jgi:excinuclease ABC subunit C
MGEYTHMERAELKKFELPDCPGVYLFKQGRRVLYVGKATILRDRVRSYFDDDLIATRGPRIVDMVTKATSVAHEPTPTVLEALVREAALIRHYHPPANAEGKDDKTFLYACITDEEIPRVLAIRGSNLDFKSKRTADGQKLKALYGPFPSGHQLREGLRLIRRIFPFFDTPKPITAKSKHQAAKIEFNRQIGQYPREVDLAAQAGKKAYRKSIRNVALFLSGRTKELRVKLNKEMRAAANDERFEEAAEARRQLFALDHIQDVSLIKDENLVRPERAGRIEAYDTAHLAGTNAIGVMVVVEDGVPIKKEYRTFNIRGVQKNDDIASLRELLKRRFGHLEWAFPNLIVIDGGRTQKRAAESALAELGIQIPVAAVVKDERHRPREILGARKAGIAESDAVLANAEAHRFSLSRHRRARTRQLRSR